MSVKINQSVDNKTKMYMMIDPILYPPKIQSTRLNLNIPTKPQFNPPINKMIRLIIFNIIIQPP